jgi:hypothetical protein
VSVGLAIYNKLEKLGLFTFEHRLVARISSFAHKIINNSNAPVVLKSLLTPKHANAVDPSTHSQPMQLRSKGQTTLTHKLVNIPSRHPNALKEIFKEFSKFSKKFNRAGRITF